MEKITVTIPSNQSPIRIDKYLNDYLQDLSRNRIQQLIQDGHVWKNGNVLVKSGEKIVAGDHIEVQLPPPEPSEVLPEAIPLDILYQDDAIAVINKPAGLSVHPTPQKVTGTLVNALLYHLKDLSGIGGVLRPGIVHRLDRVTSGVLLIAKNDEAHRILSDRFKTREIKKTYWAIVHGSPPHQTGEIDQPIGRHPTQRKQMTILAGGRNALTSYKIMKQGLGGSFLEVYPYTGRTHQIRVHCKSLGCPIVGDTLYALRKYKGRGELERLYQEDNGIALHAHSLEFKHPITGENMQWIAPCPTLMQSILERMK